MTAGHTPGPWKVESADVIAGELAVVDSSGSLVALADWHAKSNNADRSEADARLIASAPDLLALAERIAAWDDVNSVPELSGAIEQARAALAAARGEK